MSFIEENNHGLIYMRSDIISAKHAFTTRYGGVSKNEFSSLNLGSSRGDDPRSVRENFRRVCALFGVDENSAAVTNQVHGNDVRIVTSADKHPCLGRVPYEADGIVTAEHGLPLFCFTADCVPVLLWDRQNHSVGAVHCGWRSSVGDILFHAVSAMVSLGTQVRDICAAIGPAIGQCCFETDDDVPDAIDKWLAGDTASLFLQMPNGKTMVDLRGANARRLQQIGLPDSNIDISSECTFCHHEKYWSHRYTKGVRGNQASVITL